MRQKIGADAVTFARRHLFFRRSPKCLSRTSAALWGRAMLLHPHPADGFLARALGSRPLLQAALLFGLGDVLSLLLLTAGIELPVLIPALLCAACLIPGLLASFRLPACAFCLTALAIFFAGMAAPLFQAQRQDAETIEVLHHALESGAGLRDAADAADCFSKQDVIADGIVVSDPVFRDGRTRFELDVLRVHPDGSEPRPQNLRIGVRASIRGNAPIFRGDKIRARLRLSGIQGPDNPGVPDLRRVLKARGIHFSGSVRQGQWAAVGEKPFLRAAIQRHRRRFASLAEQTAGDAQAAGLVRALALGDRRGLEGGEAEANFRASGLAHLFSVSGLHVGVVAFALYRLLRRLLSRCESLALRTETGQPAAALSLPILWGYVLLTGAAIPAIRAGVMMTALFLARLFGRERDAPSSLSLAFLLIAASDPAALLSPSFQLSFAAVAGLLILQPPILRLISRASASASGGETESTGLAAASPRWRRCAACLKSAAVRAKSWGLSLTAATLAATLATFPLTMSAFGQVPLMAVPANLAAIPLGSLLTALSALSAITLLFSEALAVGVLHLASPLAALLLRLVSLLAELPGAGLTVNPLSPKGAAAACLTMLAVLLWKTWRRAALTALVPALILAAWPMVFPDGGTLNSDGRERWNGVPPLRVTFLAVGQGDSALIRFPDGSHVLVDGGGSLDGKDDWRVGMRAVVPALRAMGAARLDAAILTHPHPDHGEGLLDVLRALPVRELWLPSVMEDNPMSQAILEAARNAPAPPRIRRLTAGDTLHMGGAVLDFLHPAPGSEKLSVNDQSLVFRLHFGGASILFTGDLEAPGEKELLKRAARHGWNLKSDVLKMGHHGSPTSTSEAFLRAVSPGRAVISCGRDNLFGFPAPRVLRQLAGIGADIHRTDLSGAVAVETDGRTFQVLTPFRSDLCRTPGPPPSPVSPSAPRQ